MKESTKVIGNKVVSTRPLKQYEFACEGCGSLEKMALYAVAQLTMGHDVVYTCECGAKTPLAL